MKIIRRWKVSEDLNQLRGSGFGTKFKHFWRRGWTEIPVVMSTSILAVIGTAAIAYTIWYTETHDMTPKYYRTPRIYRPEDPRVQKIRYTCVWD